MKIWIDYWVINILKKENDLCYVILSWILNLVTSFEPISHKDRLFLPIIDNSEIFVQLSNPFVMVGSFIFLVLIVKFIVSSIL